MFSSLPKKGLHLKVTLRNGSSQIFLLKFERPFCYLMQCFARGNIFEGKHLEVQKEIISVVTRRDVFWS